MDSLTEPPDYVELTIDNVLPDVEETVLHIIENFPSKEGLGNGSGSRGLMSCIHHVLRLGFNGEQTREIVGEYNVRGGADPPWSDRELDHAMKNALARHGQEQTTERAAVFPEPSIPDIEALAFNGKGMAELNKRSIPRIHHAVNHHPAKFLKKHFPPDALLVLARAKEDWIPEAKPLSGWCAHSDLASYQFWIPNSALGVAGTTTQGYPSARAKNNFPAPDEPRDFIIVECDFKPPHTDSKVPPTPLQVFTANFLHAGGNVLDLCAAVILELMDMEILELITVTWSGGESLHALFDCRGVPVETVREFFDAACRLGADPRMWLPSQLSRLPWGTRDNGQRQVVVYFQPTNPTQQRP